MQSKQHIKRLIRELDLPSQADLVIQRPKYWSPAFCWHYFERCDDLVFHDPQAGLQAAEAAPELVALVLKFSREITDQASLRLRALAILGSAYRAVGDLAQSETVYRDAFHLLEEERVPPNDRANLLFRVGMLRRSQGHLDQALDLSSRAVKIYRQSRPEMRKKYLGEALTMRGLFHQLAGDSASAVKDWSEALSCTDPQIRPRVHHVASHNLACSLVERAVGPRSLARVEKYLNQARKFLAKRPRSLQKLRLIWLRGMIMIRFGSTRRGEAALQSARRGFIEMEAAFDMAMVSLELGRYFHQSRQLRELRTLAIETHRLFVARCPEGEASEALRFWKDAVVTRTVSVEVFAVAWQAMQQQVIQSCDRIAIRP